VAKSTAAVYTVYMSNPEDTTETNAVKLLFAQMVDEANDKSESGKSDLLRQLETIRLYATRAIAAVEAGQTLPGGTDLVTAARRVEEYDRDRVEGAMLAKKLTWRMDHL